MRVGVHLPQWGAGATRAGLLQVAAAAEEAGFDSVWVADHIVYVTHSADSYPYRSDGTPFTAADGFLEALTSLAVVAGATEQIGLGTSVLVAPMRETLLLAKTIATLDALSNGRMTVAVGSGWWKDEFSAVGAPFDSRNRHLEEQLEVLRTLWTDGVRDYQGQTMSFEEVACLPLPTQLGGPRLLVGGMTTAARRRAAHFGDGWHAVGHDPDMLRAGWSEVLDFASKADRDPNALSLSTSCGAGSGIDAARSRLLNLAGCGVVEVVLNLPQSPDLLCSVLQDFGDKVLPAIRADR
jgi:probable F420-dependent oxidoreductase